MTTDTKNSWLLLFKGCLTASLCDKMSLLVERQTLMCSSNNSTPQHGAILGIHLQNWSASSLQASAPEKQPGNS